MMDHPARARVAEIMVARVGGSGEERTRGSGYLVSPGWVLTAHHVVKDAVSVGVWLGGPPELVSEAGVAVEVGRVLAVPAADLALLPVGGQAGDPLGEPALFGRLDREAGPAVPVAAAGCPRFKLRPALDRPGVLLRELDYAIGSIAALSDAKTGRFALAVDPPPGADPEPDKHSPWEGMSGAAVWASGRLIGVVGQHHPREGLATLTVCTIEQLFGSASEDQLEAWHAALPQLPATAGCLRLATPPTARKIEVTRARRAAEALAPRVLIGRGAELAALEEFTSSGARWRWIQGDAFAGKTALMAWFALHPPERVDVAACFLRRASGEDTAEYALDVLTRQLALLADRRGYLPPPNPSERSNDFADLLEEAARACAERDRQLLVLLDGLDEYDPTTASLDLADWLPGDRTLPDQAMLLAASRAGADARLPPAHPLPSFVQRITASEAATGIQHAAHEELDRAVRAPGGFLLPLLCCLAVAGSGLTASEMCALLKRRGRDADISEIEAQLSSSLRSSLMRLPNPEGTGTQVYAFAHDTLLAEARSQFASDLPTYEDLLDAWASEYAQSDWPDGTSQYLLAPYTRELARRARDPATPGARRGKPMSGTLDRLISFATDPARHDRMLAYTYGDAAALAEITTTQQLILAQAVPDLAGLGRLAVAQDGLANRNRAVPAALPALWVRLGQSHRAEAVARSISDPYGQTRALEAVAEGLAAAGQWDRAEQAARAIADPIDRPAALAAVAAALAEADRDRALALTADAEQIARAIADPIDQVQALAAVAAALAEADRERAVALAADAEQIARTIADPMGEAQALEAVVGGLVAAGQWDRAEQIARTTAGAWMLRIVAGGLVAAGQWDRAEQAARAIPDPTAKAQALAAVAAALAEVDREHALALAADAEQIARAISDPMSEAGALAAVATALAETDRERALALAADAERIAQAILYPMDETRALKALVGGLVAAGQWDRAEQIDRSIPYFWGQAGALEAVVGGLVAAGQWDRAEQAARAIPDPDPQANALAAVAEALAEADRERAVALAADAEQSARTIADPMGEAHALEAVVGGLVAAGQWDRAEQIARTMVDSDHVRGLAAVAAALAETDRERAVALAADAEQIARAILYPSLQAAALAAVATALAEADRERASQHISPGQLAIHTDRGSSMTSKPVAFLLADLGVTQSHSRPHVSNDNPYSESQFKTLKYGPDFPARFASIEAARAHCQVFFPWYNQEHRHTGLGLHTAADTHHGRAQAVQAARADVLTAAFAAYPERFVRQPPAPPPLPAASWINRPGQKETDAQ